MGRRRLVCLSLLALSFGGCLWDDRNPDNRFGANRRTSIPPRDKLPKGSLEVATRVDSLGREILAANPDLGIRPMFLSIGVPAVTAFHRGTTELYVSDGLVERCKTDAELAAVLCAELGKMAAEAQTAGPALRPEREPPYSPRLGGDVVGGNGAPDRTDLAELANWEKRNPRRGDNRAVPNQDPNALATAYLTKAGYKADDLTAVAPLLRQAEANPDFERQLAPPPNQGLGIPNLRK